MDLSSIVGWAGTALIVIAYFLVSTKRVSATSKTYQTMNVAGAIGLGVSAFTQASWPNFGLQVIWFVIGLYSLFKIFSQSKSPETHDPS